MTSGLNRPPHGSGPANTGAGAAVDALVFRRTLGHLATGVTVVTTWGPDGVQGLTANSVTSVSLNPPLILLCVDRQSQTLAHIQTAGVFGVNLLRETQEALSRFYARSWRAPDPPEHEFKEWAGVPHLIGSLGALSCRVANTLDGGDHVILLGRVAGLRVDEPTGRPLLFYRGQYAGLVTHDASPPESPELLTGEQFRVYYGEWAHEEAPPPPSPPWPWIG